MTQLARVLARIAMAVTPALGPAAPAAAHEIPADAAIQVIARPVGDTLELLVRAPLEAMQDVEFPSTGPGYLDIANAEPALRNAATVWLAGNIEAFANGRALPRPQLITVRASLPSDRSFATYDTAVDHMRAPPLRADTQIVWQQALLDAWLTIPLGADRSRLALEPRFERLAMRVTTTLRTVTPDGTERALVFTGDPGRVALDPRWHEVFVQFLRLGVAHILEGIDHLLFLLCLVLPLYARMRTLVWPVTAFTLAHSITLATSAFGLAPRALWFPPLVETAIAASILYMAIENAVTGTPRTRSAVAFAFGLIHGFGFSYALRDSLQLAGNHLVVSLASFNLGVEIGQLVAIVGMVLALRLLFAMTQRHRTIVLVICVLVGHTAWHWTAERYAALREYAVPFL